MYSFKEPYVLCWEIYGSSEYIVLVCMSYFRLIFRMEFIRFAFGSYEKSVIYWK